ncbi:hypothetical protein PNW85_05885 [[Ruminococcus] gnavus]|jgi:hypothetical protein|uniref:ABC transporter permease n=2 Tax=Mediterraneibacter gnavus TaxID=33038 RepID=A0AAW6D8U6_MEDGN|nr:hypothetical protein [Mediterraneibacter gnavus]MDU2006765.1 hypothetical protein [Lachnospiraceae bacterium]MDU2934540.1 hypothetical protein [Clostridiales bacterium]MDB8679194.1 hypothetical protein [Mediterraneibacter gnavus]MDB8686201.1 hypothetical protein [Mediterraneibacter gnavus]MDB8690373.1 hypothetical protein [Mediterraneibacter gnavus]
MWKDKKIKTWLRKYEVPPLKEDEINIFLKRFNFENNKKYRTTFKEFLYSQIQFIRKKTWVIQFVVVVLWVYLTRNNINGTDKMFNIYPFLSSLAPLLVITGVDEMARIYDGSLCEIEMTTRYPLKVVLLTRMAIMVTADTAVMIIAGRYIQNFTERDLISVMLYILVPFQMACIGMLEIMKYVKGLYLDYACVGYCFILAAFPYIYNLYSESIYHAKYIKYWSFIWIIGIVIIWFQIYGLKVRWEEKEI